MTVTYDCIATATATGGQSEILFTNISQNYTDLLIVISAAESGSDGMDMRVGNGSIDTGNNYSFTVLRGNASTASSYRVANYSAMELGTVNSTINLQIAHLMNYSNTTTFKTYLARGSNISAFAEGRIGVWRNTAAINQINFRNGSNINHTAGSTFTIYGIKAE